VDISPISHKHINCEFSNHLGTHDNDFFVYMPQFYHVSSTNGGAITNLWGYSQRHRRPIRAQARHQVQQVPRLPRKTKEDVTN
jgi:hypothetical protein